MVYREHTCTVYVHVCALIQHISCTLAVHAHVQTHTHTYTQSFQRSRERGGIDGSSELRGQLTEAQAQLGERTSEVTTHLQTITQLVRLCGGIPHASLLESLVDSSNKHTHTHTNEKVSI